MSADRTWRRASFLVFGWFGAFWGAWGASVPKVQQHAHASDGALGFALLFVGAAALPAMLAIGYLVDRFGLGAASLALSALGLAGLGIATIASSVPRLCVALALVGASSGAADVVINAIAGRAAVTAGASTIPRAHATFSALVVVATIGTGAVYAMGSGLTVPFGALAAMSVLVAAYTWKRLPRADRFGRAAVAPDAARPKPAPLLLLGMLGALALATENAHQNWSAVFARHELHTSFGLAAAAPAAFAAAVAVTRFGTGPVSTAASPHLVLTVGGGIAAVGTVLVGVAPNLPVAMVGFAIAAAGTGVLFPTIIRIVSQHAVEHDRGRATSIVTSVAYLGFLVGPVYVGVWADAAGLRVAMLGVAAIALALAAASPAVLRLSDRAAGPRPLEHAGSGQAT